MSTRSPKTCPQCGAPLKESSPGGLCPRCVMALNFNTETVFTDAPASAPPPPTPAELAPHFPQLEILECLGRGGMGVVYKARQPQLDRLVALKILAPERVKDARFAERFLREAQALAKLNHPNIVTIHDFGQTGGYFYLLMEFVDGVNLRELLRAGRMSSKEALAIVPSICEALQYAHDRRIVHRDIKPDNILLDKQGTVKIADFGIAKIVGEPAGASVAGEANQPSCGGITGEQIMGTPKYMSPEQTENPSEVDHRADIYSLGVVFYEMLTGELPGQQLQAPSKKVQIDVRLDEIVLRALEKKPELRYQQASAFKTQLETIATSPGSTNTEATAPPRFSRMAILGACWSLFPFLAALFYFLAFPRSHPGGSITLTPLSYLLTYTVLPLVWTAPFATTILGWIAIARIRRSEGRLCGLGLAVFDGLLFPLLVIDAAVVAVAFLLSRAFWYSYFDPSNTTVVRPFISNPWCWLGSLLVLGTIVLIQLFIVRRVWRNSNKPLPSRSARNQAEQAKPIAKARGWFRWAGVLTLVLLLAVALTILLQPTDKGASRASLAEQPQKLSTLPTAEVIAAGLSKPNLPWSWQELERRLPEGRVTKAEAETLLDGLIAWLRRERTEGHREPLHWINSLLEQLGDRNMVSETRMLDFVEAYNGALRIEPLARVRKGETILRLNCHWSDVWHQKFFGLVLMNEMRSILIDDQPLDLRYTPGDQPDWSRDYFYRDLQLPPLAPGKHTVTCEVESALIPESDIIGLSHDTRFKDWPPAKRQWTRVATADFTVYPKGANIVKLVDHPALDPALKGLAIKQVIIRAKGDRATALVIFDMNQKLAVPISFDVTIRLGTNTYNCGVLWSDPRDGRGPVASSMNELTANIDPLDPQLQEGTVVLTPNPKQVENRPEIDRIWGKEIQFRHIPLKRQDLSPKAR